MSQCFGKPGVCCAGVAAVLFSEQRAESAYRIFLFPGAFRVRNLEATVMEFQLILITGQKECCMLWMYKFNCISSYSLFI